MDVNGLLEALGSRMFSQSGGGMRGRSPGAGVRMLTAPACGHAVGNFESLLSRSVFTQLLQVGTWLLFSSEGEFGAHS